MDIKFDRNRVQEKLEGVFDPNYDPLEIDKNKRKAFVVKAEAYQLGYSDVVQLMPLLQQDSIDYLFNGLLCFCEAIREITCKNFSWSAVELYYCLFYLCRYKLHKNGFGIFRANNIMYYIEAQPHKSIVRIDKDHRPTTHEGTIKIFCKLFSTSRILSNSVDGKQSLDWMKDVREIVNYRAVRFYEPSNLNVFDKFASKELLIRNIKLLEKDSLYVFQPEFAVIGLPIYFIDEIKKDGADFKNLLSEERKIYLESLVDNDLRDVIINQILALR